MTPEQRTLQQANMRPVCPECGSTPDGPSQLGRGGKYHRTGCSVGMYVARLSLWEKAA